jgi:hypothetical protein
MKLRPYGCELTELCMKPNSQEARHGALEVETIINTHPGCEKMFGTQVSDVSCVTHNILITLSDLNALWKDAK